MNSTKKALEVFKRVAKEYPSTPESYQAIGSARSIYVDNGNVEDYAKWIGTLKYVAVTDADLEKTAYESAEKQYLDNNIDKAISLFNGYISKFPNGTQIIKAHYYLATLYNKQDLEQNALPHYEYVAQQSANEFTEQALQKVCTIKLQSEEDAESDLKRLELEAKSPQNILFAQSNLMKIAFNKKSYSSALDYAKIIQENPSTDDYIKNDAHIITARSAFALGDENLARISYSTVASFGSSSYGAEAQYYAAFFHNKDNDFEASNQMIQQLIQQFPSQKEFAAKGLILMAKNYYALNDAFQATYILENVIKNFSDFTELKTEATQLLETYERELSKSNASIEAEQVKTNLDEE
jgi:TolA-binding protein